VLAILVILASLILPRVLWEVTRPEAGPALSLAGVDEALIDLEGIKNATVEHCARFRTLNSKNGMPLEVPASYDHFDSVLLSEGLLDKPFGARVGASGSGALIRLVNVSRLSAATPVDGHNGAYDLAGRRRNDLAGASHVVEAVFFGLSEAEAKALNERLDGPALGANTDSSDTRGRVVYAAPAAVGALCEVHVYITHQ
jgi:hypothetical protein